MPKIFISYRREDSAYISGRIYDIFVETFGKANVLKDIDNIRLGVDFRQEIERLAQESDIMVVVIGPQWMGVDPVTQQRRIDAENDFVRIEVEYALQRGIPIIPLLIQGAPMPGPATLPVSIAPLAFRNGSELRPDPSFRPDIERVIAAITGIPSAPQAPLPSATNVTLNGLWSGKDSVNRKWDLTLFQQGNTITGTGKSNSAFQSFEYEITGTVSADTLLMEVVCVHIPYPSKSYNFSVTLKILDATTLKGRFQVQESGFMGLRSSDIILTKTTNS